MKNKTRKERLCDACIERKKYREANDHTVVCNGHVEWYYYVTKIADFDFTKKVCRLYALRYSKSTTVRHNYIKNRLAGTNWKIIEEQ